MTTLHSARKLARRFGLDINRYNRFTNDALRTVSLIKQHEIDLVIDVGANDGGYAKELRTAGYKGSILSFEPLVDAHAALLAAARLDPKWFVADRMALGDKQGEMQLNVAGNSKSSSLLDMLPSHVEGAVSAAYIAREKCDIQRLDMHNHDVIQRSGRIFLKMDTQGFEKAVYEGARRLMPKIYGIQTELSVLPLYEGQALYQEMLELISLDGFEIWNVVPGFMSSRSGRMMQFDAVLFK